MILIQESKVLPLEATTSQEATHSATLAKLPYEKEKGEETNI